MINSNTDIQRAYFRVYSYLRVSVLQQHSFLLIKHSLNNHMWGSAKQRHNAISLHNKNKTHCGLKEGFMIHYEVRPLSQQQQQRWWWWWCNVSQARISLLFKPGSSWRMFNISVCVPEILASKEEVRCLCFRLIRLKSWLSFKQKFKSRLKINTRYFECVHLRPGSPPI